MLPPSQRLLATILGAALFSLSSQAASNNKQCYGLDGTKAGDDKGPCNPDAEVSACCAINKARPDICTSSGGLCLAQDRGYTGMLYANGCTDPTGTNRNCPQICRGKGDSSISTHNVLQCNPGGAYCCRASSDTTNCCNNTALQVSRDLGTFQFAETRTSSSGTPSGTPSGTSSDTSKANGNGDGACPRDRTGVIVGGVVGGVLGAALLAALGTIAALCRRRPRDSQQDSRQAPRYSAIPGKGKGSYGATQPQELPGGTTAHEMRG